jgi:sRNA-binding protein
MLPNRDEIEAVIRLLADRYPRCFFEQPRQRQPLKKNLFADLEKDNCDIPGELLSSALDWYQSHLAYQYQLTAGRKRLDLHGKEVGTVTEQEQREALARITQINATRTRNAVAVNLDLHAARRIPDDQLRKLDAPQIKPRLHAADLEPAHRALAAAKESIQEAERAIRRLSQS